LIPLTILSQGFGVESLAQKFLGVIEEAAVRDGWTLQIGLPEEAAKVGQFINSGQSLRTRVLQLNGRDFAESLRACFLGSHEIRPA
jgi:hypothetical protein